MRLPPFIMLVSTTTDDDEEAARGDAKVDDGKVGRGPARARATVTEPWRSAPPAATKAQARDGRRRSRTVHLILAGLGAGCAGSGFTTIGDGVAFRAEAGVGRDRVGDAACGIRRTGAALQPNSLVGVTRFIVVGDQPSTTRSRAKLEPAAGRLGTDVKEGVSESSERACSASERARTLLSELPAPRASSSNSPKTFRSEQPPERKNCYNRNYPA